MKRTISVSEFRAKCLQLVDEVARTGKEVIVTKRGRPVAKIVPVLFGRMKGTGRIIGDIIGPTGVTWEADQPVHDHGKMTMV